VYCSSPRLFFPSGYTVGNIYTSLTGFSAQDSAGSVQLASLGRLLCQIGFVLWDLGMDMDYKRSIGSHLMNRKEFVDHIVDVRVAQGHNRLPSTDTMGFNCKDLIDQNLSLETLFNGGEKLQATDAFVAKSRKVTDADTDNQCRSSRVAKEFRQNNTSSVHHDRGTTHNQNASPQKKPRNIFNKQKVVVR